MDSLLAEVEEEEAKAGHDGLLHERPGVEALVLHGRSGMGGEVLDGSRVGRHMLTLAGDDWRKQLGLRKYTMLIFFMNCDATTTSSSRKLK